MAYRSSSTTHGTNVTTLAVAVPTGVQIRDIVVIGLNWDANVALTSAFPSGFTVLLDVASTASDGGRVAVGWKRLTAVDSGTYSTGALVANNGVMQAVAFSGRDSSAAPTLVNTINGTGNTTPVTATAPTITALVGDDILWWCAPDYDTSGNYATTTAPGSYIKRQDDTDTTFAALSCATRDSVAAGATGAVSGSFTLSGGTSGWIAALVRTPAAASFIPHVTRPFPYTPGAPNRR